VFTGTSDPPSEVACNDDTAGVSVVRFGATAGTQYLVMAGTCCGAPAGSVGPGGDLVLNAYVAPPPLAVDITVDRRGVVTGGGRATISGTVTCSLDGRADLGIELVQRHGRLVARGSGGGSVACGPAPTAWSLQVDSFTGVVFGPGQADATPNAFICTATGCASDQTTGTVQLRRA
jgi:hypothetical protein